MMFAGMVLGLEQKAMEVKRLNFVVTVLLDITIQLKKKRYSILLHVSGYAGIA